MRMKTLISTFLFLPIDSQNLFPRNMKRNKFSDQKTTSEQEFFETLITKHCASNNGGREKLHYWQTSLLLQAIHGSYPYGVKLTP